MALSIRHYCTCEIFIPTENTQRHAVPFYLNDAVMAEAHLRSVSLRAKLVFGRMCPLPPFHRERLGPGAGGGGGRFRCSVNGGDSIMTKPLVEGISVKSACQQKEGRHQASNTLFRSRAGALPAERFDQLVLAQLGAPLEVALRRHLAKLLHV